MNTTQTLPPDELDAKLAALAQRLEESLKVELPKAIEPMRQDVEAVRQNVEMLRKEMIDRYVDLRRRIGDLDSKVDAFIRDSLYVKQELREVKQRLELPS